ncbi:uncharacterized protein LOC132314079 [Cornus florida]|uniref:uncharacterized protein LOC132314079 n=1 Tax=Cornus florida TaxID=4283 RepID=UPI002896F805|nr:uncharacterized protein LOC132314079 [Cornus florida]
MSKDMDVADIARYWADILNRHVPDRNRVKVSGEQLQLVRLESMTLELALSRTKGTDRYFWDVLAETQFEVKVQMVTIMADEKGLEKVLVEEEGHVCGVCQDEMEVGDKARAMGCMHLFHGYCIVKWLIEANACPLCRHA